MKKAERHLAKILGQSTYTTGRPCKRGHTTERWVLAGECVACKRMRGRSLVCRGERKRAKILDQRTYVTGRPCKHGHIAEREVSSGQCLTCKWIRGHSLLRRIKEQKHNSPRLYYYRLRHIRRELFNK